MATKCFKYYKTLMIKLINKGEIIKSPNKKHSETIVFVPFYYGKKQHMKRHAKFMADLGYDSVIYNHTYNWTRIIPKMKKSIKRGWGIKHVWANDLTKILDAIPGEKIIFAFSNPSTAALEAIHLRNAKDIKAIIFDGGPFFDLIKCNWNFFVHAKPQKNPLMQLGWNVYARGIWTIEHEKEIIRDLAALPKDFPVLSIRGWQDPLVPPSAIEKAFQGQDHLDLEILNLPEGKHVDGLKNFPDIYKSRVADFLESISK